ACSSRVVVISSGRIPVKECNSRSTANRLELRNRSVEFPTIIGSYERARISPKARAGVAQRARRSRRFRFSGRGVSASPGWGKTRSSAIHGLAVAGTHAYRAMGHPRVQPNGQARLAAVAGRKLATGGNSPGADGLEQKRTRVPRRSEGHAGAGG